MKFRRSNGVALLDLEAPWKVIARGKNYLLAPYELYERVGDVPNVTFPCSALVDSPSGRVAIYYGCADSCVGLCFGILDEIDAYMKKV